MAGLLHQPRFRGGGTLPGDAPAEESAGVLRRRITTLERELDAGGIPLTVVDTAGLRRPSRIDEPIETYAAGASLRGLMVTEVAVLVLDAKVGGTDQDLRLADLAWRKGRGLIVSSGCAIGRNTPPENFKALIGAARKYGTREYIDALY